jgi:hypothetical protein
MASRPPETDGSEADARNRWMIIQALRTMGVALAVFALLLIRGVVDVAGASNEILGYALLVVGLGDAFVIPQLFAKKWRTPPQ